MSNRLNTNSFNIKDEYYTPKILAETILEFIPENKIVWCPFDTVNSEIVIALKNNGNKVIATHIADGYDFFDYEPKEYDLIVSNPLFTKKLDVLKRLYDLEKPFAMILGLPILNYHEIGDFFIENPLQLLIVNKKVSFDGNTSSFNNSWFCYKMLPKDLMFVDVKHTNARKNYEPSAMEVVRDRIKEVLSCDRQVSLFDSTHSKPNRRKALS